MKKIVAILLSTLPFILIYFISITGKIMSQYVHIPVERIAVLNDFGDELGDDDLLTIDINKPKKLDIKIYPSLASDKTLEFTFSDKENISINENYEVLATEYGIFNIIAISKDNYKVFKEINIKVAKEDIESIEILEEEQNITLDVGASKTINAIIHSKETLPEFRRLEWSSNNTNVASVDQNGKITAISEGNAVITVNSAHKKHIKATINVTVRKIPTSEKPVYFDVVGNTYETSFPTLDLLTITKFNVEYTDLKYKICSNLTAVDESCLNNSYLKDTNIKIVKENVRIKVEVSIKVDSKTYVDEIFIKYKK